jgi:hypothetical protein
VVPPAAIDNPMDQPDEDWTLVYNLQKHIEKLVDDDWEVSVEFGVTLFSSVTNNSGN